MTTDERNLILGAFDTMAVELANHGHQWTEGERAIYEEAVKIIQTGELETPRHPDLIDASRNFTTFLRRYVGDNDEWPVEIKTKDTKTASEFVRLLNDLNRSQREADNVELMTRASAIEILQGRRVIGDATLRFSLYNGFAYWKPGNAFVTVTGQATIQQLYAMAYLSRQGIIEPRLTAEKLALPQTTASHPSWFDRAFRILQIFALGFITWTLWRGF